MSSKIQYQADAQDEQLLRSCTPDNLSINQIAHREYQRYRALLDLCRPLFNESEALLLCAVLRPVTQTSAPQFVAVLAAWVSQQVRSGKVHPHPNIKVEILLTRLEQLGPGECQALWDSVERFWLLRQRDTQASDHDLLQNVGLLASTPVRSDLKNEQATTSLGEDA